MGSYSTTQSLGKCPRGGGLPQLTPGGSPTHLSTPLPTFTSPPIPSPPPTSLPPSCLIRNPSPPNELGRDSSQEGLGGWVWGRELGGWGLGRWVGGSGGGWVGGWDSFGSIEKCIIKVFLKILIPWSRLSRIDQTDVEHCLAHALFLLRSSRFYHFKNTCSVSFQIKSTSIELFFQLFFKLINLHTIL